jgi:hypothetical protein
MRCQPGDQLGARGCAGGQGCAGQQGGSLGSQARGEADQAEGADQDWAADITELAAASAVPMVRTGWRDGVLAARPAKPAGVAVATTVAIHRNRIMLSAPKTRQ